MANPTAISRRVSYILPSPSEPPPYLSLPPLDQPRRGHPSPFFIPKSINGGGGLELQSRNPFLSPEEYVASAAPSIRSPNSQPKHCLGVTSLALDTSTLLENNQSPGGILYSGARDGLVCSWELNVPHKRRRGGRYEIQPGRGSRVKWEKIGDGAEFFEEDEDYSDDEEASGDRDRDSSDDEDEAGMNGKSRGEVPYEDRWEVDTEALAQNKVSTLQPAHNPLTDNAASRNYTSTISPNSYRLGKCPPPGKSEPNGNYRLLRPNYPRLVASRIYRRRRSFPFPYWYTQGLCPIISMGQAP